MSAKLFLADESRYSELLSFWLEHLEVLEKLEIRADKYLSFGGGAGFLSSGQWFLGAP